MKQFLRTNKKKKGCPKYEKKTPTNLNPKNFTHFKHESNLTDESPNSKNHKAENFFHPFFRKQ